VAVLILPLAGRGCNAAHAGARRHEWKSWADYTKPTGSRWDAPFADEGGHIVVAEAGTDG